MTPLKLPNRLKSELPGQSGHPLPTSSFQVWARSCSWHRISKCPILTAQRHNSSHLLLSLPAPRENYLIFERPSGGTPPGFYPIDYRRQECPTFVYVFALASLFCPGPGAPFNFRSWLQVPTRCYFNNLTLRLPSRRRAILFKRCLRPRARGCVVCGGIHLSMIPAFNYDQLRVSASSAQL